MTPERTTARRKASKPNSVIATNTIEISPAAGPLTPNLEPLNKVTTRPPMIPAIIPENGVIKSLPRKSSPGIEAWPIPKQRGKATRKTTSPAGKSFLNCDKSKFLFLNICIYLCWKTNRY